MILQVQQPCLSGRAQKRLHEACTPERSQQTVLASFSAKPLTPSPLQASGSFSKRRKLHEKKEEGCTAPIHHLLSHTRPLTSAAPGALARTLSRKQASLDKAAQHKAAAHSVHNAAVPREAASGAPVGTFRSTPCGSLPPLLPADDVRHSC